MVYSPSYPTAEQSPGNLSRYHNLSVRQKLMKYQIEDKLNEVKYVIMSSSLKFECRKLKLIKLLEQS